MAPAAHIRGGAAGDFVGTASASTNVTNVTADPLTFSWASATVTADVGTWVANAANNHGWIVIGNAAVAASGRTAKAFDTRENATEANRPRLTVVFRPPLP